MIQTGFSSTRILLPARAWFVYGTLLLGFTLNLLPTAPVAYLPDWLALVLCFWCVREGRKVGIGIAFLFGVATDVAYGSIMGQHALGYAILAYGAAALSRRILWFPLPKQALQVLPLLLVAQVVSLFVGMAAVGNFPGLAYLIGPFIGALLWMPGSYLLLLPQYRPVVRDENRPL